MIGKDSGWAQAFTNRTMFGCRILIDDYDSTDFRLVNLTQKRVYKIFEGVPYSLFTFEFAVPPQEDDTVEKNLSVVGNTFKFAFCVNDNYYTEYLTLVVSSAKVDNETGHFKVEAKLLDWTNDANAFESLYNMNGDLLYNSLDATTLLTRIFDESAPQYVGNNYSLPIPYKIYEMTKAEMIQNVCVAGGMFTTNANEYTPFSLLRIPTISDTEKVFPKLNVFSTKKDLDTSKVSLKGVEASGENQTLLTVKGNSGVLSETFYIPEQYQDFLITSYVARNCVVREIYQRLDPTQPNYVLLTSTSGNWEVDIVGKKISENKLQSQQDRIIYSPFINDISSTATKREIETYYLNDEVVEIKGRIDPSFEPADWIYVEGLGAVFLEEVSFTYNGAFNGTYKGRLKKIIQPPIFDEDNTDIDFLAIINPNNFECTLHVIATSGVNGGEFTAVMSANQGKQFAVAGTPLEASFLEYYNFGIIDDEVYAYFSTAEGAVSDNVIILEGGQN